MEPRNAERSFGWDPVFQCEEGDAKGMTYSEMSVEQKNEVSHRGKAFREFVKMF